MRVRLHSTTAEDKHPERHEKAHENKICDCGRTSKQFETLRSSLADRTTGRVNLDWIPGELLYD
ncbi:MAG: hypothetical protein IT342_00775 [Candidatus Melainabacteria bacterium]|nr:hypothetical protein [Candidatus Melainabacteria bacterium]